MKTIISLSENQMAALDFIRSEEHVSRTELIRRAVDFFLKAYSNSKIEALPGFGGWKDQKVDALQFQSRLRDEWCL